MHERALLVERDLRRYPLPARPSFISHPRARLKVTQLVVNQAAPVSEVTARFQFP